MNIVIVEDEVRIREGIEKLLMRSGGPYKVTGQAENGVEGLKVILEQKPDLVITDIRMPDMDGIEMLAKLRESGSTAKAVVLTAYSEFDYARQAIRLGVSEYLLKPVVVEELMGALCAVEERLKLEQTGLREALPKLLETLAPKNAGELNSAQVGLLVAKARAIAEQHFQDGITLDEIAQRLSVTPEYLGTQIHKEMGITFGAMMKALRISKAKKLLLETDRKLYEIAEAVGYTDAKYFARVFQQDIGIMPLEFRRLHKSV